MDFILHKKRSEPNFAYLFGCVTPEARIKQVRHL